MDENENPYEYEKNLYDKATKRKEQAKCDFYIEKGNFIITLTIPESIFRKHFKTRGNVA